MAVKKLSDLPQKTASDNGDGFVITSVTGQDMRVPFQNLRENLSIDDIESSIQTLQENQTRGFIGYETKSAMDLDTAQDEGTIGFVTNDTTAANNGYYRYDNSAWVKRDDFYATSLDPAGTSEAVTGKAVGDYRVEKINGSFVYNSSSDFTNVTSGDLTFLKDMIKKIEVRSSLLQNLNLLTIRRNLDEGADKRWAIYLKDGNGDVYCSFDELNYTEPTGIDKITMTDSDGYNIVTIWIDWSEMEDESTQNNIPSTGFIVSKSCFIKTRSSRVFQEAATFFNDFGENGELPDLAKAFEAIKITGVSPEIKLSPYLITRNDAGKYQIDFYVEFGNGTGDDKYLLASWVDNSYVENEGVQYIKHEEKGATFEVWIDWDLVPTGVNGSLTYNRFGLHSNIFEVEAVQPKKFYALKKPNGFSLDLPGDVYKSGGKFFLDFDFDFLKPNYETVRYVNPLSGSSGDGLSWGSAYNEIDFAIADLNSEGVSSAKIILKEGFYFAGANWLNESPSFDLYITCETGKSTCIFAVETDYADWTKTTGQTNVYEYTKASGAFPSTPIDWNVTDEFDRPKRLIEKASIADVDANEGSYYLSGDTIYIHRYGSLVVGSESLIFLDVANSGVNATFSSGGTCFSENIDFIGGVPFVSNSPNATNLYFKNCGFGFSRLGDGLDVDLNSNSKVYLKNCDAFSNFLDGFNYHRNNGSRACDVIEINCRGWSNGFGGSGNNNGTTLHDGAYALRINGVYVRNENRNVHDINDDTQAWMLGCIAADATGDNADPYDNSNFMFGREGNTDQTTAWLDSCISDGGSVSDLAVYENSVANIRNFVGGNNNVEVGTIQNY